MLFVEKRNHYTVWTEKTTYIITQGREKREVFRGSILEVNDYMNRHPYGTPKKENR